MALLVSLSEPAGLAAAELTPAAQPQIGTAELRTAPEAPRDAPAAALPSVLSFADVERYRKIFAVQEKGLWRRADAEIKQLEQPILMGAVLAQRYLHPTRYRSHYRELKAWLAKYADQPDARRIYRLALRKKAKSARGPRRPVVRPLPALAGFVDGPEYSYTSPRKRSRAATRKAGRTIASIRRYAMSGYLTKARRILSWRQTRRVLDRNELEIARAYLGAGYFFRGSTEEAYRLTTAASKKIGRYMPLANWFAGLAAYRLGRYTEAAAQFETMAESKGLSSWTASGAAFWAARSHLVAGNPAKVSPWLRKAAAHERTFYGLLAGRVLGIDRDFDWKVPPLTPARVAAVLKRPAGRRALALLQIEDHSRAERELMSLTAIDDPQLGKALLAVAEAARLPSLSLRTAAIVTDEEGAPPDGALYPLPQWQPEEGFIVDRAVIYAVMRQESRFNERAKSSAGARGLMQLMPATAGFMARKRFRGSRRNLLYDPELNISLAQRYLRYLIDHQLVNGDMLLVAAAYNGGPGNLAKWRKRAERRNSLDPLLFIESIPARETRNYIERVLANLWIYRNRLGQQSPSLDRLAAGQEPFYKSLDGNKGLVAENDRN